MSSEAESWAYPADDGVVLRVHVVPGASRPGVAGFHGESVRIRVRARPVEGAANRELAQVLADVLGVRAAAVSIEAGAHGREKRVLVRGVTLGTVRGRLERPNGSVDTPRARR
jgi:uncharacterized protein (TIGR00251 family)